MGRGALIAACVALATAPAAADAPARRGRVERVAHRDTSDLPSFGPRLAPVTIEAFLNFGDRHHSGRLHDLLRELGRRHPRRLRVVYRLIGDGARGEINPHLIAALEAHAQGRFFAMVDEMFRGTMRSPRLDALPEIAARAGVDPAALARALDPASPTAQAHAAVARASYHRGRRLRMRTRTGLVVNGTPLERKPETLEELEEAYDVALAAAQAALDAGVPLAALEATRQAERLRATPVTAEQSGSLDGPLDGDDLRPRLVHLDPRRGEALGRSDAPLTVTLFCNLETLPCGYAAQNLDELGAAYPDEVRLVFRHAFDSGDRDQSRAERYARAAHCAARAGHFDAVHDLLLLRRGRPTRPDDDALVELAGRLGLDQADFRACLDSPTTSSALAAELVAARREGVRRTPSIVIAGRLYPGSRSFDELADHVDRALAPGVLTAAAAAIAPLRR